MKVPTFFISCFLMVAIQASKAAAAMEADPPLQVGFYSKTCPMAEAIVRSVVQRKKGYEPGIIRMHFHDCFVRGCDGSVLLDSVPGKPKAEKDSPLNNPSLGGFSVFDEAKALVEAHCPNTVSCADILAFAARDAAFFRGGIVYEVPAGRRDGRVSLSTEADVNLPLATSDAEQLVEVFARKGLSGEDMVALSGAHKIGRAHCNNIEGRLYPQDLSMDPVLASYLKSKCTLKGNTANVTVPQNLESPNLLDNQYYKDVKAHKVLFRSDQALQESNTTAKLVDRFANDRKAWMEAFAKAMVRMGFADVLTGEKGEIRKNCRVVNQELDEYTDAATSKDII